MKDKIIAVIPAFNEASTIGDVITNVKPYVDMIIIVDDGSLDETPTIATRSGVTLIKHERNQGYDSSLNSGFKEAIDKNADIIITLDADAQHNPADIPKIVTPILNGEADIVIGIRTFKQRIMEHLFALYSKSILGITDPLSGVKAYRADVYKDIGYFDTIKSTGTQLMFEAYRNGYVLKEIPIDFYKRTDTPRFGRRFSGNFKILISFIKIVIRTFRYKPRSG